MKRPQTKHRFIISIFLTISIILFLFQIMAPLSISTGTLSDLSGRPITVDNWEKIKNLEIPWRMIYWLGDVMCHQKKQRSFFINDNQMPFCSRCTGIWAGLVVGFTAVLFIHFRLNGRTLFYIILGILPLTVDGLGQMMGLWRSTNYLRFLSGLLAGLVFGITTEIIISEISCELDKSKVAEKHK